MFVIWQGLAGPTRPKRPETRFILLGEVCATLTANLGFILGHTLRKYCLGEAKMYNCLTPPTPDITKIIIYATLRLPAEVFFCKG